MGCAAASRQGPGCGDQEVRGPSVQAEREGIEEQEGESGGVCLLGLSAGRSCLGLSIPLWPWPPLDSCQGIGAQWRQGVELQGLGQTLEHGSGFGCRRRRIAA